MKRSLHYVANNTRSKKRKLCQLELPSKRRKNNQIWVSATHTRNYMLNDAIVDWLKLYSSHRTNNYVQKTPMISAQGFNSFIMDQGIKFESKLIQYMKDNINQITTVSEYITESSVKKTISLMKNGVPIIHSAPVRDTQTHTKGVIDLLVRSDYLHKIVDECPIYEEKISAPKLTGCYYYVVIDIKYSTLPLRADGIHILNTKSFPAYKSQLCIYNNIIGKIQGHTPRYSYILGRRWGYTQKDIKYNSFSCLNKLGVVDFQGVDQDYLSKTEKAIRWVRDVKKNGHKWSVSPPSKTELYPNMCYDSGKWQKHKQKIAENIGEISNIWYCGVKHREKAFNNDVKSWKDQRCTSEIMGMKGTRASVIDQILNINRQNKDMIRPKQIDGNFLGWKDSVTEMFVDFETMSDIFSSFSELPQQKPCDMIFMIGVYWKSKKSGWGYKNFICNKATYEEEYKIMDQFNDFYIKHKKPKLWFWHAEPGFWSRAEKRQFDIAYNIKDEKEREIKKDHISDDWSVTTWTDMCSLFKYTPIVVKDCFKFGLKQIAGAMKKHNLIETKIDSECASGLSAMINAWRCYQDYSNPKSCPVMLDISKYNEFDCKVLYEILQFLRKNHM